MNKNRLGEKTKQKKLDYNVYKTKYSIFKIPDKNLFVNYIYFFNWHS